MEIEEIQDLIDFHKRNLKDSQKMAKSMLGGFMGEAVANQAFEIIGNTIKALEEYRDLLGVKKLVDGR